MIFLWLWEGKRILKSRAKGNHGTQLYHQQGNVTAILGRSNEVYNEFLNSFGLRCDISTTEDYAGSAARTFLHELIHDNKSAYIFYKVSVRAYPNDQRLTSQETC